MKLFAAIALGLCLTPCISRAGALNLATLTCEKYESEVLPAAASNPTADSLNTVMWLFGYSVAKSGAHVMYPEALGPFGFALDNECKANPGESLLDALAIVKRNHHHDVAVRLFCCKIRQPHFRRGFFELLSGRVARRLWQVSQATPVRRAQHRQAAEARQINARRSYDNSRQVRANSFSSGTASKRANKILLERTHIRTLPPGDVGLF
jgi:hypothetical protein